MSLYYDDTVFTEPSVEPWPCDIIGMPDTFSSYSTAQVLGIPMSSCRMNKPRAIAAFVILIPFDFCCHDTHHWQGRMSVLVTGCCHNCISPLHTVHCHFLLYCYWVSCPTNKVVYGSEGVWTTHHWAACCLGMIPSLNSPCLLLAPDLGWCLVSGPGRSLLTMITQLPYYVSHS